jgi:hypothetical protein
LLTFFVILSFGFLSAFRGVALDERALKGVMDVVEDEDLSERDIQSQLYATGFLSKNIDFQAMGG